MHEPAVRLGQAGLEFGKESHEKFYVNPPERLCGDSGRARFSFRRLGLELFHAVVGQLYRADERPDFAVAVAIAAARDEQAVVFRDLQVPAGKAGGMLGMETFNPVQTRRHQVGNDFIRPVQSRMRHDSEAAGLVD